MVSLWTLVVKYAILRGGNKLIYHRTHRIKVVRTKALRSQGLGQVVEVAQ